jgi:hypothetical protein
MDAWNGWELGRVILAFSALLYAGIWVQLTLYHWGAGFRRWEMYPPVIITPVIVALALLGLIARDGPLGWITFAALALGVIEGLGGTLLHLRGAVAQIGGATVRNLMSGPPPVLPVAYALAGALGLLGLLWDA